MSSEAASIEIRRRVDWMDTDAAGIYHWTTVARFAEAAEVALHNSLGIAGETFEAKVNPRLSVHFEFQRPLRFNDEGVIQLRVDAVGRSSVRYQLQISDTEGLSVATGEILTCLVETDGSRSRPWPDHVRMALTTGSHHSE